MACIYSTFEIICHKLPSPGRRARARSLAAALMLSACLALGAAKTAVPVAVAQELQWATSVGGDGSVSGAGIATGPSGESYVTGSFDGTVTFGAGEPNETVLEAVPTVLFPFRNDMFLATYASDGTLAWATSAGGISQVFGRAVATDPQGNSYVTGTIDCGNVFVIMCTATFGAGEANETVLEPMGEGGSSIFVAKYARDGALLWAKIAGGGSVRADGRGIATEPRGNSYVTGSFVGMVTFGAGEAKETVLEPYVRAGLFVAKYAPDGTFLWVKSAGATELREDGEVSVFGLAIVRDARGNSYVAGSLECDFISRKRAGHARRRLGRANPKRLCLRLGLRWRCCSWRNTAETALSPGPRARVAA